MFQMIYYAGFTLSDLENLPVLYRERMYNLLVETKEKENEEINNNNRKQ